MAEPNIRYPTCSECRKRPGIIQITPRDGKRAPYCSECARPLIFAPRPKVMALGPTPGRLDG